MKSHHLLGAALAAFTALLLCVPAKAQSAEELIAALNNTELPWFLADDDIKYTEGPNKEFLDNFPKMTPDEVIAVREKMNNRVDAILRAKKAVGYNHPIFDQAFFEKRRCFYFFQKMSAGAENSFRWQSFVGDGKAMVATPREILVPFSTVKKQNDGWYFCNSFNEKEYLPSGKLEAAKEVVNRYNNLLLLMEDMRMAETGGNEFEGDAWRLRAILVSSIDVINEAISHNSKEFVQYKPVPKAGALNATLGSKAIATAKDRLKANITKTIVEANDWYIERNAFGTILRRTANGYLIIPDEVGNLCRKVTWAQDYNGSSYGALYLYGIGVDEFYVK